MSFICTDCKVFQSRDGCEKNLTAWNKAKELYPVSKKEAVITHYPRTENEKARLKYINTVAARCQERVIA
jgi:murein endopeptidase